MKHPRYFLRQLAATCLALSLSLLVLVAMPTMSAAAQVSADSTFSASRFSLLATTGRVKAEAKKFEGKTQESIGNVTGNQGDRLAGKAKQAEAKVRNVVEDVKDKANMG